MHDIVIITTYSRPDYLRLCLEYLSRAEGIENKEIRIYVDRGKSLVREIYEVVNDFRCALNPSVIFRDSHSYHGNSYNTLESYKEAYQTEARFIYLVEDDVLVMPDFFRWHETVQQQENLMCSVAYRCSRNQACFHINDPAYYLVSKQDYASIGVCWKREQLAPVIEHAIPEYYNSQERYVINKFPNNRFSNCFTEQDGLIQRLLDNGKNYIAWPFVPRAYHIGFSGYHRLRSPRLSYSELKEVIHNMEKIKEIDKDFGDIEAVPKEPVSTWNKLYCAQVFD